MFKNYKWLIGFSTIAALISAQHTFAQKNKDNALEPWQIDTLIKPIPTQTVYFTNKVEKAIEKIDLRDGKKDRIVKFRDELSTEVVTKALIEDAAQLVILVENLDIDFRKKIIFHKATENLLNKLNNENWTTVKPSYFGTQISSLRGMIISDYEGKLLEYVKQNPTLMVFDLIDDFENTAAKQYLYAKLSPQHPELMLKRLPKIVNEPYADEIVKAAAYTHPGTILTYAQSTSQLSAVVRRNNDPMVKTIVEIADKSRNKLKVLPFVGAIQRGEKTIKEIDNIANDEDKYLQALVDLVVANEQLGRKAIEDEIKIRTIKYVRKINELHNDPDAKRFASIQQFRDVDYYVMMIGGQDEIYTSSYTKGPFALMMKKMNGKSGKELLKQMNYYHFRTFIRLAAGFNRLSDFLGTMNDAERNEIMVDFVKNLEQGGANELEDAVDVADAFGSIKDEKLLTFLKSQIIENYERVKQTDNAQTKKGLIVYGLLAAIFNSSENSSQLEGNLKIPPITYVPNAQLKNENGEIIEQVYFYGDQDGKNAYSNFMTFFKGKKEWKVEENAQWVKIKSNGAEALTIYANKPLDEETGGDDKAQKDLKKYLDEHNIIPTVIIHRGHSYYVPTTLSYLTPDVKVVMLGSCGGYHNLSQVLDRAPDAHIISSKQTGTQNVNMKMTLELHKHLLSGKDLNWLQMWKELDTFFSKASGTDRGYYQDYIPPHRNLGSIFVKAYRNIADSDS